MSIPPSSRAPVRVRAVVLAVIASVALGATAAGAASATGPAESPAVALSPVVVHALPAAGADTGLLDAARGIVAALGVETALAADDALFGRSGKLRARFVAPQRSMEIPVLARLFGDSASFQRPGVHRIADVADGRPLTLITLVPFSEKVRGRIGSYRMGFWPYERGTARNAAYANPPGFIQVTLENRDTQVSEHFRLRDFLTKDQATVWPKYLVLREALLDKLELVIEELEAGGVDVEHMQVMSGFRTPQYNDQGVGAGGRAQNSRHQYGDAADVFVDNDRDGRLDDLNGDRRVDTRDVQVMVAAAERVERRYPELLGGAGVYRANSAHGPFVHIDVRGTRARW